MAKQSEPLPLAPAAARAQSAPPKERRIRTASNGTFMIEGIDGPTAEEVDEFISSTLCGSSVAADLRSTTWGDRLRGIEMLQARVEAKGSSPPDEREKLFKVCVTVLARVLHDKIVPVYLPALQLLQLLYSAMPGILDGLAMLGRDAAAILVPAVVLRAGSSNMRAREESATAITTLAASPYAGASTVCPHALRPLANNKVASAAGGRLELLHALVIRFGFGSASGMHIKDAVHFLLPFYDEANDRTRESAHGIVREALIADARQTVDVIRTVKPQLAKTLAMRAGLEQEEKKPLIRTSEPASALKARPLPRIVKGSNGDVNGGFWAKGGFGDENVVMAAPPRPLKGLPEVKQPAPCARRESAKVPAA